MTLLPLYLRRRDNAARRSEMLARYYYAMRIFLKKIALGVLGGILAIHLLFAIGLTGLEWIVRENPKVEESLEVFRPHRENGACITG